MRYPISKVERILGVSQSTIRRYEDAGLIHVRRAEESKYRFFSISDIATLSVHLGTRQKDFLYQEIKGTENSRDGLTHIYARLKEIDKELAFLEAEKTCWNRHVELYELMERARNAPEGGVLCQCEALVGSYFEDEQSMYDALYFVLFRERSTHTKFFRLCSIYQKEAIERHQPEYRQAYCAPLNLISREDIVRTRNQVHIPQQECIVAYAPGSSVIDDENLTEIHKRIGDVHEQIERLLGSFNRKLNGDVVAMTVTIDTSGHNALLYIPVK